MGECRQDVPTISYAVLRRRGCSVGTCLARTGSCRRWPKLWISRSQAAALPCHDVNAWGSLKLA